MKAARIILAALLAFGGASGAVWCWIGHDDKPGGLFVLAICMFLSQLVQAD